MSGNRSSSTVVVLFGLVLRRIVHWGAASLWIGSVSGTLNGTCCTTPVVPHDGTAGHSRNAQICQAVFFLFVFFLKTQYFLTCFFFCCSLFLQTFPEWVWIHHLPIFCRKTEVCEVSLPRACGRILQQWERKDMLSEKNFCFSPVLSMCDLLCHLLESCFVWNVSPKNKILQKNWSLFKI